ncbi:MAG: pimeloyl-ACP methyl ester carboxylesterase [Saprospiraceae bacterium]|jgi:pimeloyl-ACP methyl ester carboxylesterase
MPKKSKISIADLRGLTGIVTDATVNVTDLVEEMNKRIVHPPFLPSTPIQHLITGVSSIAYNSVRLTTKLIGGGLEKTLKLLNPLLGVDVPFEKKETTLAILNGVVGDYLIKNNNPLAIPMQLRYQGELISLDGEGINKAYPKISGKILLMVHGLCMNDLQWDHKGHNHGESLARELNLTPVYLHYNAGLHISTNGQSLNTLLEELIRTWPAPLEELVIIAHSMGGLVSRSAIHYGKREKKTWTKYLKKVVFLGSPHHGAPMERVGNFIDHLLEAIPYAKPFARLGKMRSAGITDLRFGNLIEEDRTGEDRFENHTDERMHIPLPEQVSCYTIAASIGKEDSDLKVRIVGDGLVQLGSALGQHKDPNKNLNFKKANTSIAYETNHMDLLNSREVYDKLKTWLLT